MNKGSQKIRTGPRVGIIGGGPAGSLFALYLLHYSEEKGIHPETTIYQQRNFDEPGPKGCKGCAGILSMSLLSNLTGLGLTMPKEIIQTRIEQYTVHSPYTSISMSNPEKGIQIVSVYRGCGPRISHYADSISFDGWLLREAQNRGVRVENQKVSYAYLGTESGVEVAGQKIEYDLVVLASAKAWRPIFFDDYRVGNFDKINRMSRDYADYVYLAAVAIMLFAGDVALLLDGCPHRVFHGSAVEPPDRLELVQGNADV